MKYILVTILMSHECLKSLSPWFWKSRNFLLEMGGGGSNNQEYKRKRGVHIKRMCAYERGRGVTF